MFVKLLERCEIVEFCRFGVVGFCVVGIGRELLGLGG